MANYVDSDIVSIRKDLKQLTKGLLQLGQEFATARRDQAHKQAAAKLAYAKAYATLDPSMKVGERAAEATQQVHAIQLEADIAEAEVDALKQLLRVSSDCLNALQSQARLLTTEIRMSSFEN